ncbi:MAG: DNA-processing protein DprA [Caldilineaceae bacterium]
MTLTIITPNARPIDGPAYPQRLRQRLAADAPPLTIRGPVAWLNDADHPIIALFSSVKAPAKAILQAHEWAQQWRTQPVTIVSGFHSPLEEEVWSVLMQDLVDFRSSLPDQDSPRLVKILARGMMQRFSVQAEHCIATGTIAFVSPFSAAVKRPTKATALLRNQTAAALANSILIAHAEVGSSTAQLVELAEQWTMPMLQMSTSD